jgi:hypothetical protein
MNAYHGDTELKAKTLEEMRAHQAADEIVQGQYWSLDGGKLRGCAVGCLTKDPRGGHDQYPTLWGIPEPLAYLEDTLFESLSVEESKGWPVRFLNAIPVGADLSRVWDKWNAWCLRDLMQIAGANAEVVEVMAALFERASEGDEPSGTEWIEAGRAAGAAEDAREAAWAAEAAWVAWASWVAARDARDAWVAARAAEASEAAARDAWAAWASWAAADAARSAWAARVPADAAWSAWDAAREEWASRACDALVAILEIDENEIRYGKKGPQV